MPAMSSSSGPKSDPADLALFLAQCVVDQPSLVRVTRRGPTVLVRVAPGEEGRLIGRQGRVIQAIRTLVRATSDPRERVNVDLDAPRKA
ncbi:MAG: KH domain-containing protein [Deinococcus sp.]|uniref:KH domain-containing protein n=1 Tax=Deinococcus sp. TaxID=47478 RepID=UPI0026DC91BF|nr:KH domain-containing protein [Deinococcus sp.]MDO4244618.1 KH domain-containing protein [Deinococcus sp.]